MRARGFQVHGRRGWVLRMCAILGDGRNENARMNFASEKPQVVTTPFVLPESFSGGLNLGRGACRPQ